MAGKGGAAGNVAGTGRRGAAGRGRGEGVEAVRTQATAPWLVTVMLVVAHLVLALLSFDPTPHTGGDNASYISLAHSLLERGTYQELYDPALPPHTQYPPAFPAILAFFMLLGIGSWVKLKLVVVAFSAAAVGATYLWLRRRSGPGVALGVALVLAASPLVLDMAHWVLSDVPFWAFTALALWAYDGIQPDGRGGVGAAGAGVVSRAGSGASPVVGSASSAGPGADPEAHKGHLVAVTIAIAATVLSYFTRSAGLPLALAAGGWLAWRRRWRELAILVVVLLPLASWWWLRARALGGVDYVNQFWWVNPYAPELGRIGAAGLVQRIIENTSNYAGTHLPLLLVGSTGGVAVSLSVVAILAALVGWGYRLRSPGVAEIFFPLYLGLILVWPAVWSGERFLLPAYPLIQGYAAELLVRVVRRVRPGAAIPVGTAAVALVLLLAAPALRQGIAQSAACMALYRAGEPYPCLGPVWRDFYGIAEWARESLPDDAVVVSRKPRLFYGLSERRGVIYPFSTDPEDFFAAVRSSGARYLVLDQLGGVSARYLGPVLESHPDAFCFLHGAAAGHAALLGIRPESEWSAGRGAPGEPEGQGMAVCPSSYLRFPPAE